MNLPEDCPVSQQEILDYQKIFDEASEKIQKTNLSHFRCALMQLHNRCKENASSLEGSSKRLFLSEVLAKIIDESWGLIGCLEKGALTSSFHHARSIIEIVSQYYYVNYKPQKVEKRIKKFFKFKKLARYRILKKSNENPELKKSLIKHFGKETLKTWEKQKSEFCDLYDVEEDQLKKVNRWQYPATIENMISETPGGKNISLVYSYYSSVTHLTSDTKTFSGTKIIGLPSKDDKQAPMIDTMVYLSLASYQMLIKFIAEFDSLILRVHFPKFMNNSQS